MAHTDPIGSGDSSQDPLGSDSLHGANGAQTNGTLATVGGSQLPSVSTLNWSYGPPPRPEILSAKPNPLELLHAVRRRWPLAVGLGVLIATLAGAAVWYLIPVKYEAFALLKVSGKPPQILERGNAAVDEFAVFKRTQVQLLLSNMVINGVLREPAINRLPSVQENSDDPISWLKEQLVIDYPDDAEIMRVAMKGKRKDDLLKIVNKLVEVYMKEIVQHEKQLRLANETKLQVAYEKQAAEYQKQLDALKALEAIHKTKGSEEAQLKKIVAMEELQMRMADRARIVDLLADNAMQTMLSEARQNDPQSTPDVVLDMELSKDPIIMQLTQTLAQYQDHLSELHGVAVNPQSTAYTNQIQHRIMRLEEAIEERKAERRPRLQELLAVAGSARTDAAYSLSIDHLKKQKEFLDLQLAEAEKQVQAKSDEVAGLESFSAQVLAKQEELDALRLTNNQLRAEIDRIQIERLAPDRITEVEEANLANSSGDVMRKYIAIVFVVMLSFSAVVLGVAILEFTARKVNSVKEVNDGLGIRVVGELPNIGGRAFRRVKGGKGQNVLKALMAERIDGTRTALIHTTAIDPPRVVMVTSADPHEGKTTTASQLAASLARSGRRTLLVDADVRSPGVHRVFEMPQDPGLCELLRGEADRDAVIHPTRTANLWLMPAGRCDLRSVQALSSSYLGTTIAALSVQFDYVVIDSGPVLKVADPLLVGQHVDAAMVSVLKDVSKVPHVYEAVERLRSVGITVLGSVVNGVKDDVARHGVELLMAETPQGAKAETTAT